MSAISAQVPAGFGADAKLNYTDYTKVVLLGFPPVNGTSSGAKWSAGNVSFHLEGSSPVHLRVAVYTHGKGWRVSKVVVKPGDRTEVALQTNDYRIAVTRVDDPNTGANNPVAVAIESLLAA